MQEIILVLEFVIGLVAIIKGADWLTDGAASIAHHFGIPTIVVGLTIVAVGSSMPEFVVSVVSAFKGNVDMALGNVVGSNIFNILGIVGITALVMPITIDRRNMKYDVPFVVLSSLFIAITAFDSFFDTTNPVTDSISRSDGLLMLCTFIVFMSYTLSIAQNSKHTKENSEVSSGKKKPLWKNIMWVIIGLVLLVAGGDGLVEGASGIARWLGVSESVIGLTLVAGGTSLPELATSVVAALKKSPEMAIGNVVGSNLFNIFLVLGASASITPLHLIGISNFDLFSLVIACVLLWLFGVFYKKRTITRIEGTILVVCYVAYVGTLIYMS